jgi:hypothetical protein
LLKGDISGAAGDGSWGCLKRRGRKRGQKRKGNLPNERKRMNLECLNINGLETLKEGCCRIGKLSISASAFESEKD